MINPAKLLNKPNIYTIDSNKQAIKHPKPQNTKLTIKLIQNPLLVVVSTLINYKNDYLTGNNINGNAIITTQAYTKNNI